ncbi:MAG: SH3 domain-containing protein [Clostridia bacterium]|nr:SH3 domain-containing protein [Clostridia bacterium]
MKKFVGMLLSLVLVMSILLPAAVAETSYRTYNGTGIIVNETEKAEAEESEPFEEFLVKKVFRVAHGRQVLRIRKGPGIQFEQIGTIAPRAGFMITGIYESLDGFSGRWYKLERLWDGEEGFVSAGTVWLELCH